jgi:N-acetylmuramoyl-L-alanine amidase
MLLLSEVSYAVEIKDVRLWRAPDHTRVVLDLSGPVKHTIITLSNPDRIVIDISKASIKTDLAAVDLHNSPVKRIRSGVKDKKDLRLVLDLSTAVKPRSFLIKKNKEYGDRLVIDLQDKKAKKVVKHVEQANQRRDIVIAIDAGHGGEDPGAIGPGKLHEKKVVMAIAKELNYLLQQEVGYQPVLIRKGDYYVGLSKRRKIARNAQADLLVSIHADAFKDHRAKGTSVYALSSRGATSATAKFLAEEANNSDLVGGVSLSDKDDILAGVLTDLSMNASLDASMQIGSRMLKSMDKISRLHSKKVEQASFVVLKSPDIPSVLVESGFISNPAEAKKLNTKSYQRKMARAIFTGIKGHFSDSPPPDTYLAWAKRNRIRSVEYTIARGDTLSDIAQRYKVSVVSIRQQNDLSSSVIKVGQRITIPAT